MGQNQLLLLVLGVVLVGISVVVAIQAFSRNQEKAAVDAIVDDGVRFISDAQAWGRKAPLYGGGGDSFSGASFERLGYDTGTDGAYSNVNGRYTMVVDNSASPGTVTVIGCTNGDAHLVATRATGFEPGDVQTFSDGVLAGLYTLSDCP